MKAILIKEFGAADQLYLGDAPTPTIQANEVLIKVKATALNRADTLQRKGAYPPPLGASEVLGLEMAGVVEQVGNAVTRWKSGDKVFGLLAGGGYAEYVATHEDMLIAIPADWDFKEATAIPEVFMTAFQAISYLSKFQNGETILIHAGASGVGTAAIQLAKSLGAGQIIVTASAPKHQICKDLGADVTIDYKTQNFEEVAKEVTGEKGVDVIIDFLGASYLQKNINSLAMDGRMVILAFMGGIKVDDLNIMNFLRKRIKIMGSTLRARELSYKIQLTQDLVNFAMPKFITKELCPIIDSVYDWKDVAEAHRYMEANKNQGKIILEVS